MAVGGNGGKSAVALVRCDTYDEAAVEKAVREGLELIGGVSRFIKPGEKIVMKPNVLLGRKPGSCVCTHPAVFKAVGRVLLEAGAIVSGGDSSGFGTCAANMGGSGLKQAAEDIGVTLADFDNGRVAARSEGLVCKRFVVANGVLDADGVVSLPKLKTHGLTTYTGAIKNTFGCIPGLLKTQHHARYPDVNDFSAMLVDLNMLVRPRLFIMDGVMAMEGNGPNSGAPRHLGVILFSTDPVALDAVACRIIDLDPALVPTSGPGERAGLGTYHDGNITVLGGTVGEFVCKDFRVERKRRMFVQATGRGGGIRETLKERAFSFIKKRFCQRPVIDKDTCTRCGLCVTSCPLTPKAVNWVRGDESSPPAHDYNRCIRCFCCQEFCSAGAISVEEPRLVRVLSRLYGLVMR